MFAKVTGALASLAISAAAAEWERLAPLPEPNGGCIAAADGSDITILGGTNWIDGTKRWLRSISRFDPKWNRWETIGQLSEPVAYAVPGIVRDAAGQREFVVMLGGSNGMRPVKSLAIVDTIKSALQPAPQLPDKIVLSAGGIIGDAFVVVGGSDDAASIAGFTNRAFSFDWKKRTLTPLPDFPGRPFGMAASSVADDELFIFGGANWDEMKRAVSNTAAAYAFSVMRNQWRELKPLPFAVRGLAGVNLDGQHIYLAGGYTNDDEEFTDAAFIFDVKTGKYTAAQSLPYKAMVSLVKSGEWLYCLGGEDRKKHRSDAVFRIRWKDLLQR